MQALVTVSNETALAVMDGLRAREPLGACDPSSPCVSRHGRLRMALSAAHTTDEAAQLTEALHALAMPSLSR